jgi:hypothetical protein
VLLSVVRIIAMVEAAEIETFDLGQRPDRFNLNA